MSCSFRTCVFFKRRRSVSSAIVAPADANPNRSRRLPFRFVPSRRTHIGPPQRNAIEIRFQGLSMRLRLLSSSCGQLMEDRREPHVTNRHRSHATIQATARMQA